MQPNKSIILKTGSLSGTDYFDTTIEISSIPGKMKFSIIGLNGAQGSSQACISRISAALFNNNIRLHEAEYIISISPGNIRKYGTHYDLPIVAGLLYLNNYISCESFDIIKQYPLFGEFSLTGKIILFAGMFSLCLGASLSNKTSTMIIPGQGLSLVDNIPNASYIAIDDIQQLRFIHEMHINKSHGFQEKARRIFDIDMSDIYGQEHAKRALEIAAAGKHHCILSGPPGCGKTMLAKTLPTILPVLNNKERIEVNAIYSSAGLLNATDSLLMQPPFRSPHHSSSIVGLIGGGKIPFPGDVTLAHNGVLFLDEFLELSTIKIEMLRQILEDRKVNIKKNDYEIAYPASFILLAAFNPCPCGYYGSTQQTCTCTLYQIKKYMSALSGPILDRIDMQVNLDVVDILTLERSHDRPKTSALIAQRVEEARNIQYRRYGSQITNAEVPGRMLEKHAQLSTEAKDVTLKLFASHKLSMRGYHKVLRVSRTIADLDMSEMIEKKHFVEALSLRNIEKLIG